MYEKKKKSVPTTDLFKKYEKKIIDIKKISDRINL